MDIKEEIDLKDSALLDPNTLINKPEYSNIHIKIEKDIDGTSMESSSTPNIKQEINIEDDYSDKDLIQLKSEENLANSNDVPTYCLDRDFRKCFVPSCQNSNVNSKKIFIAVPKNEHMRRSWCLAVGTAKILSSISGGIYCCEDHFNMEQDCDNWMQFRMTNCRLRMKKNSVPHTNLGKKEVSREVKRHQQEDPLELGALKKCKSEVEEPWMEVPPIQHIAHKSVQVNMKLPIQQTLEIKEDVDVKDVCTNGNDGNILIEAQNFDAIDVKIEEDYADLSKASLWNGSPDDIKQGIDIIPPTLLDMHLVPHSDHYDFKCDICHKNFKQKSKLKIHLVTHSNNYDFECDICQGKFKRKANFKMHLLTHSKHCDFKCDICHKKFKRKDDLKSHSATHSNKYDFECNICHKKYSQKKTLNKHLLMHSNHYNFECDICHKNFKQRGNLNKHLVIHSKKCDFECNICLVKFTQRRILQRHLAIHSKINNLS